MLPYFSGVSLISEDHLVTTFKRFIRLGHLTFCKKFAPLMLHLNCPAVANFPFFVICKLINIQARLPLQDNLTFSALYSLSFRFSYSLCKPD